MRSLDCQIEYWNDVGPTKTFAHPIDFERLALHLDPTSRILDYGCGYGRVLGLLRERGYRALVGVDPAPAMIAAARASHPGIEFHLIEHPPRVPFPDHSFDAVVLFAVLTCIPTDAGQHAVIEEVSRVLAPDGLLYISDLWIQDDERNRRRYAEGRARYGTPGVFELDEGVVLRHQERGSLEALVAGYRTLALEHATVETMNGHHAAGFQWLGRDPASTSLHQGAP